MDVRAWLLELAVFRAERVVPSAGGVTVLHDGFPRAHDQNKLVVTGPCSAEEVAADADRVLGGAGRDHRLVEVLDAATAQALTPGLLSAGYERDDALLMLWEGPAPAVGADPRVVELDLARRVRAGSASWREDLPAADPDVWDQLGGRAATVAGRATFLGVLGPAGGPEVVARADLYLGGSVAQVEDVDTRPEHRRQGLAGALVLEGVARAYRAGATTVFLLADAQDWPQAMYRRLGFTDVGTTSSFRT